MIIDLECSLKEISEFMKLKLDILSFLFFMLLKLESFCIASCSEVFTYFPANSIQVQSTVFSGQVLSVRQWIKNLTSEEIKEFIPEWSHLRIIVGQESSSKVLNLLSRFANRINLEHGALFAVAHRVEISVFEALIAGKMKPMSVVQYLFETLNSDKIF